MRKLQSLVSAIILFCMILCLCTSCSLSQTDAQIIEKAVLKLKETPEFEDKEILNINKPVLAQWYQITSKIMIIPLDDEDNWILDDYIILTFDGQLNYDLYGKGGAKSDYVEKFMEQINEKRLNGFILNNFIQNDLIVTLEFSDNSKVVFDRYYKEIEENLKEYRNLLK